MPTSLERVLEIGLRPFQRFIGNANSLAVQLWALRDGLRIVVQMSSDRVEIKTGASPVVCS